MYLCTRQSATVSKQFYILKKVILLAAMFSASSLKAQTLEKMHWFNEPESYTIFFAEVSAVENISLPDDFWEEIQ